MAKMQNFVMRIQTALLFMWKQKILRKIAEDVETRFDTSSFDRPLSRAKNKKGQIMKEFVGLWAKTFNYLKSNNYENQRAKGTKMCVINRKRKIYRLWKLFRTSSNWK